MNFKTLIWKNLHARIWFFVSIVLMTLVFVTTMIVTLNPLVRNTLYIAWGEPRAIMGAERGLFERGYDTKEKVLEAANELNTEIASEGFTLLQNKENSLPLAKNLKVSVFGKNSTDMLYGGSGSGAKQSGTVKTIFDSLTEAGFTYNPALKSFYEAAPGRGRSPDFDQIIGGFPTGETPVSTLISSAAAANNYAGYTDAALVVITRIGGEGFDLPRSMANMTLNSDGKVTQSGYTDTAGVYNGTIAGARKNTDHYLQLDKNEVDLLMHVSEHFENIVLVINSNNTLELGFLDDASYWTDTFDIPAGDARIARTMGRIRSALWIGSPGSTGIMALGGVLNGDINPSGRTVDIYARDFSKDPVWQNFGNNNEERGNAYRLKNGNLPASAGLTYYVEYEEGVYLGYRYYETRSKHAALGDGAAWYNDNVMYPFGHGLSYSAFDWTIGAPKLLNKKADGSFQQVGNLPETLGTADADKYISVDVTVTNKAASAKAGKDVVQLYVEAPYYENGIEKPHVVLADFAKTKLLEPGASDTVTLTFSLYDIASYDYNDDNGNGFKGWELESGGYKIHVSKSSHSWADNNSALTHSFKAPQTQTNAAKGSTGFTFRSDPHTENSADIVNRFDDVSYGKDGSAAEPKLNGMSRANWIDTFPATPTVAERSTVDMAWLAGAAFNWNVGNRDTEDSPWYAAQSPAQAADEVDPDAEETIKLVDMWGVDYNDEKWDAFLNQLTISQMTDLVGMGAFGTVELKSIGMPRTLHADGPAGFTSFMAMSDKVPVYNTCFYASSCVIGATYNKQLAYEFGEMIGNEGLVGNERGDGQLYSGWYAPAVNIHRSQFSGRNWEYFSEDAVLTGKMAAEVVKGAKDKGVITFVKHFALNDQETSRSQRGILTWATEQTMREIYLKAFEIVVKEGKTIGMMSSYNRIGTTWAGGDYRLLTKILRNEWGFNGVVITDYATPSYVNANQMIRAGGDLQLYQTLNTLTKDTESATHVTALRRASKNILYATVNSNAMNNEVLGYRLPIWTIALIWINIGLLIAFVVWGAVAIYLSSKKIKKESAT